MATKKKAAEKEPKVPKKTGRPTKYTKALGERICEVVSTTTYGLRKVCTLHDDFPCADTVRLWKLHHPEFSAMYAQAKLHQADVLAEDCLDIADDDSRDIRVNDEGYETFNGEFAARSRIRIDTRKWLAAKLLPKQYGDKLQLEQKTEENDKLKEELVELRAKLDAQNRKDY